MRRSSAISLLCAAAIFCVSLPATTASAFQPVAAPSVTAGKNAALRYWVVFSQISKNNADKLRDVDFDKLLTVDDVKAAYTSVDLPYGDLNVVGELLATTKLTKCDFELENSPMALMPHLGQIRTCARLLRLDARRLQLEGKRDEAAQRIAAIFRMAVHVSSDRFMISSLVGVAVAELGFTEGTKLLGAGKLSASAAAELRDAAAVAGDNDPMLIHAATTREGRAFPDWLESELALPDGAAKVNSLIADTNTGEKSNNVPPKFTVESLRTELPKLRAAYAQLDKAWDAADPFAAAVEVEKRCVDGQFGELAKIWLPSMSRAYKTAMRFKDERSSFQKLVQSGQ